MATTKADKARTKVQKDEAAAKAAKDKAAARKKLPIPEIRDGEGEMKKLKQSDFPTTREGRLSWCDYNIAKWTEKKTFEDGKSDPKAKAKKRREKLMKMLAELDAELGGNES